MLNRAFWIGSVRAISELTVRIAIVFALFFGLQLALSANGSPGAVIAIVSCVALLVTPVRDLGRVYEYWTSANVAREKIGEFLEQIPSVNLERMQKPKTRRGKLAMRSVTWAKVDTPFSTEVTPGGKIVLMGPNGSGKTSLLWMLAGVEVPLTGLITVDGVQSHLLHPSSLRPRIGIASIELPLVRGSVSKNIRYRYPRATESDIHKACADAGLNELIQSWTAGLGHRIEENGRNLSEGEKAKIQLARAVICTPRILLLDEISAHFDIRSNQSLQHLIRDYPGTVIFSSHDPELVRLADKKWEIVGNSLVEESLNSGRMVQPAGKL